MPPILVGRELRKAYRATQALRGANIAIGEREIVAVMGPSGSGKSTLLHCLAGVLTPDSGEVTFDGRRIDRLRDRARVDLRRTAFGLVYQYGQLVPELPAVENIALPLLLAGRRRREAIDEARGWLARVGLEALDDRSPGELSGGQGQRVAIARALVGRPRVVFADEPTGSLDSYAADQVMELLVDAVREQGTTVVMVTHEPRVAGYADRTVLLRDGVETGGGDLGPPASTGGDSLRVSAAQPDPSAEMITWGGPPWAGLGRRRDREAP
jgi:putative ABC transport system ATP-binding protein